jgi:hypothetical protein
MLSGCVRPIRSARGYVETPEGVSEDAHARVTASEFLIPEVATARQRDVCEQSSEAVALGLRRIADELEPLRCHALVSTRYRGHPRSAQTADLIGRRADAAVPANPFHQASARVEPKHSSKAASTVAASVSVPSDLTGRRRRV